MVALSYIRTYELGGGDTRIAAGRTITIVQIPVVGSQIVIGTQIDVSVCYAEVESGMQ